MATEEQKKDCSRSQSSIAKIVSQLQDKDISRGTLTAIQELQERIEDWKGIRPGDLGEMILCKTLYVTKSSKTHLVSCLSMKFSITSNVVTIVSRVSFPEHASPLQRESCSKFRRVIVLQVEILIRTEADKVHTEGTIPPETHTLGHSNIQTMYAPLLFRFITVTHINSNACM
jgi:hypothetical protein